MALPELRGVTLTFTPEGLESPVITPPEPWEEYMTSSQCQSLFASMPLLFCATPCLMPRFRNGS